MLKKLFKIIPNKEKIIYVNFIYIIIAIFELLSLSTLLAFVIKIFAKNSSGIIGYKFLNYESLNTIQNSTLFIALLFFAIIRFILVMYGNFIIKNYSNEVSLKLKISFLKNYFLNYSTELDKNDLLAFFINKIETFARVILDFLIRLGANIILTFAILFFIYLANPKYFFYIVLFVTIYIVLYHIIFSNFLKKLSNSYYKNFNQNISDFNDVIDNLFSIKIYGKQKLYTDKVANLIKDLNKDQLKYYLIQIFPRQFIEFVIILFLVSIYFFIGQDSQVNDVIVYMSLLFFSFIKLMPSIIFFIEFITNTRFFSQPINEILRLKKISTQKHQKKNKLSSLEKIVIKNCSLKIKKINIFSNINKNFEVGDIIGICGPSGSGKTSFVKTLLGLTTFNGKIYYDNIDLRKLNLDTLYHNISYVQQKNYLLNAKLFENITLETDFNKINLKKLKRVVESVDLNKPMKKSVKNFSGGEAQRIAIARALYFNRKIQIYDEATNAIDKFRQNKIIKEIKKQNDKLIFIVSHDPDVLKECNKIINL